MLKYIRLFDHCDLFYVAYISLFVSFGHVHKCLCSYYGKNSEKKNIKIVKLT